jgi:hypothetical protein
MIGGEDFDVKTSYCAVAASVEGARQNILEQIATEKFKINVHDIHTIIGNTKYLTSFFEESDEYKPVIQEEYEHKDEYVKLNNPKDADMAWFINNTLPELCVVSPL